MSNRFLNNRKLTYKEFLTWSGVIDFVNYNRIESDDIQQIVQTEYHIILLIYWE